MLSNMSFTNNLGTIGLTRINYSLNHSLVWNGGSGTRSNIEISVTGNVQKSETDFFGIIGNPSSKGFRGTLVLPNKTYSNMRISNISFEGGIWVPWGIVTMSFTDETEDGTNKNIATLTDGTSSFLVYEPKISLKPSTISLSEKTIHLYDGYFRQKLGHDFIKVSFNGVIILEDDFIPDALFNVVEQQGVNGLPRIGELKSFIPESESNLNVQKIMITDSNLSWRVEKRSVTVSINFIAPPQNIEV
ncbi:MAG: hypothetical protein M0P71_01375 [Melioribacteraceae bacterium]|nr:hypothetical protein [Melioribacteraceae bacterium]